MNTLDWLFEIILGVGRRSASVVDPHCPYCGFEIDPPPSAKRNARRAAARYTLRPAPNRRRYLVTREQARAIQAEHLLVRQREQAASKVFINVIALEAAFEI